ncbi:hypothetical protein ABID56_000403 [Alkalibacillus flavidus]|uniref:Uncharacterized protein n=1 Tax=Alkalibacillus flavidus TaxID=546021 RepID=A0ABV2KRV1_9BACI
MGVSQFSLLLLINSIQVTQHDLIQFILTLIMIIGLTLYYVARRLHQASKLNYNVIDHPKHKQHVKQSHSDHH